MPGLSHCVASPLSVSPGDRSGVSLSASGEIRVRYRLHGLIEVSRNLLRPPSDAPAMPILNPSGARILAIAREGPAALTMCLLQRKRAPSQGRPLSCKLLVLQTLPL